MSDRDYLYGHVCAHGSLARSCQVCDLEDEVCDLEDEVRRLRARIAQLEHADPLDVFTEGGA